MDGVLVPLSSTFFGLLPTPANLVQEAPDMIAMIAHPEGALDHDGHSAGGPHLSPKAIPFSSLG